MLTGRVVKGGRFPGLKPWAEWREVKKDRSEA
jgi:hypothetical protein